MALVAKCDRCGDIIDGEALRVLCRDLCGLCYADCERFMATPPTRTKRGGRLEQAQKHIQRQGYVCAKEVAYASGEAERKLYFSWYKAAQAGYLTHLGGSRFAAPVAGAAE